MLHRVNFSVLAAPLFVWQTADGDVLLLGTLAECGEIAAAIQAAANGEPVPELSEYDPALTPAWTVEEAAAEAQAIGYDGDPAQLPQTIRAAARRGSIRGATQIEGRWSLPRRTFRHWLQRHMAESRGRPSTRG